MDSSVIFSYFLTQIHEYVLRLQQIKGNIEVCDRTATYINVWF